MRIIPIDDLQAGMVLAQPALNDKRQVLLGAGIKVTDKHISVLRNFNVMEVTVEGEAPPEAPIDPNLLAKIEDLMRPAFTRANLKHPMMQELYRQALMARVRRAARGAGNGR